MTLDLNIRKAAPAFASALALGLMLALTSAPQAMAAETIRSGTFVGQSKHVTTGKMTIEIEDGKTFVVLGDKFSLDGAPAPTLGFSKGGKFDKKTEFAKLKMLKGRQVYELPKSIVISAYDAFTIWCADFNVPLGSAKFSKST